MDLIMCSNSHQRFVLLFILAALVSSSYALTCSCQPNCDPSKRYPNPTDCGFYYTCNSDGSIAVNYPCETAGYHFSPTEGICLSPLEAGCAVESPRSDGMSYKLTFQPGTMDVELSITSASDEDVTVTLDGPDQYMETLVITPGDSQIVTLPASFRQPVSGTSNNVIGVDADGPINVVTLNGGSCSTYLTIPSASTGYEHYITNWWSTDVDPGTVGINIVATESWTTTVFLSLPDTFTGSFAFEGEVYSADNPSLVFSLTPGQAFNLQEAVDFTGTKVTSTGPVSIHVSNVNAQTKVGGLVDNMEVALLPVETWSTEYIVPPVSEESHVRVLAVGQTTLTFDNDESSSIVLQPYEVYDKVIGSSGLLITASRHIQVVSYTSSVAAILIPATPQFKSLYKFRTRGSEFEQSAIVVMPADATSTLTVDDQGGYESGWSSIAGSNMVTRSITLEPASTIEITTENRTPFMVYIHGTKSGDCGFAFPAGSLLVNMYQSVEAISEARSSTLGPGQAPDARPSTLGPGQASSTTTTTAGGVANPSPGVSPASPATTTTTGGVANPSPGVSPASPATTTIAGDGAEPIVSPSQPTTEFKTSTPAYVTSTPSYVTSTTTTAFTTSTTTPSTTSTAPITTTTVAMTTDPTASPSEPEAYYLGSVTTPAPSSMRRRLLQGGGITVRGSAEFQSFSLDFSVEMTALLSSVAPGALVTVLTIEDAGSGMLTVSYQVGTAATVSVASISSVVESAVASGSIGSLEVSEPPGGAALQLAPNNFRTQIAVTSGITYSVELENIFSMEFQQLNAELAGLFEASFVDTELEGGVILNLLSLTREADSSIMTTCDFTAPSVEATSTIESTITAAVAGGTMGSFSVNAESLTFMDLSTYYEASLSLTGLELTAEMMDTESQAFIDFSTEFSAEILASFSSLAGEQSFEVTALSAGSVEGEVSVSMQVSTVGSATFAEIQNELRTVAYSGSIGSFTVSETPQVSVASASVEFQSSFSMTEVSAEVMALFSGVETLPATGEMFEMATEIKLAIEELYAEQEGGQSVVINSFSLDENSEVVVEFTIESVGFSDSVELKQTVQQAVVAGAIGEVSVNSESFTFEANQITFTIAQTLTNTDIDLSTLEVGSEEWLQLTFDMGVALEAMYADTEGEQTVVVNSFAPGPNPGDVIPFCELMSSGTTSQTELSTVITTQLATGMFGAYTASLEGFLFIESTAGFVATVTFTSLTYTEESLVVGSSAFNELSNQIRDEVMTVIGDLPGTATVEVVSIVEVDGSLQVQFNILTNDLIEDIQSSLMLRTALEIAVYDGQIGSLSVNTDGFGFMDLRLYFNSELAFTGLTYSDAIFEYGTTEFFEFGLTIAMEIESLFAQTDGSQVVTIKSFRLGSMGSLVVDFQLETSGNSDRVALFEVLTTALTSGTIGTLSVMSETFKFESSTSLFQASMGLDVTVPDPLIFQYGSQAFFDFAAEISAQIQQMFFMANPSAFIQILINDFSLDASGQLIVNYDISSTFMDDRDWIFTTINTAIQGGSIGSLAVNFNGFSFMDLELSLQSTMTFTNLMFEPGVLIVGSAEFNALAIEVASALNALFINVQGTQFVNILQFSVTSEGYLSVLFDLKSIELLSEAQLQLVLETAISSGVVGQYAVVAEGFTLTSSNDCPASCTTFSMLTIYDSWDINGDYVQTSEFNGKPVFQNMECNTYLYFVDAESSFWIFGPVIGEKRGWLMSNQAVSHPSMITEWSVYSSMTQSWGAELSITLTCACNNPLQAECAKLAITNSDAALEIQGEFGIGEETSGGRPTYKHTENDLYLYYNEVDECQKYWAVGPEIGGDEMIAVVASESLDAGGITGDWSLLVDGVWTVDSNTNVECL